MGQVGKAGQVVVIRPGAPCGTPGSHNWIVCLYGGANEGRDTSGRHRLCRRDSRQRHIGQVGLSHVRTGRSLLGGGGRGVGASHVNTRTGQVGWGGCLCTTLLQRRISLARKYGSSRIGPTPRMRQHDSSSFSRRFCTCLITVASHTLPSACGLKDDAISRASHTPWTTCGS